MSAGFDLAGQIKLSGLSEVMATNSLPVLYVKPGCPWCVEVEDFLEKNAIAVRKLDVVTDAAARAEMQKISGQSKAPTLDWNGKILADFGVDELRPFLTKLQFPFAKS